MTASIPTHSELRALAEAFMSSQWSTSGAMSVTYGPGGKIRAGKDILSLLDQRDAYREALESIVQQATIADDPAHHTLGFIRIRAEQALSSPSTDRAGDTDD